MKTAIRILGTALSVLLLVPTFLTGCGIAASANDQTANPIKAAANTASSW